MERERESLEPGERSGDLDRERERERAWSLERSGNGVVE